MKDNKKQYINNEENKKQHINKEENKKQYINKEQNKKAEVKFPQFQYGINGNCTVYTEKGMCHWLSPSTLTLEENIKYLKFVSSKFDMQIEVNKKNAEEEAKKNKPPVENKEKEYKPV